MRAPTRFTTRSFLGRVLGGGGGGGGGGGKGLRVNFKTLNMHMIIGTFYDLKFAQ